MQVSSKWLLPMIQMPMWLEVYTACDAGGHRETSFKACGNFTAPATGKIHKTRQPRWHTVCAAFRYVVNVRSTTPQAIEH